MMLLNDFHLVSHSLRRSNAVERTAGPVAVAFGCLLIAGGCSQEEPSGEPGTVQTGDCLEASCGAGGEQTQPPVLIAGAAGETGDFGSSTTTVEPADRIDEGEQVVSLDEASDSSQTGNGSPASDEGADAGTVPAQLAAACEPFPNAGSTTDGDANVDLSVEFQRIAGFGGINVPGWIADLTPDQVDTAFGNGPGQIGMSILRVRVPFDVEDFAAEVPTAQRAVALGATVFATPWTPPASMKSNNNTTGGELLEEFYGAYADHLLSFRDVMSSNGVQLEAISIQNEPDIAVDYESCDWTPQQMVNWLIEQGPRFGETKIIAAESFNFNRNATNPILDNPQAVNEVDIIGGHIYGNGLSDYPEARAAGKEVWMTEHYTESANSANLWPLALDVGTEIHQSMEANFSAYIWWYIRRAYGPITEDGQVSKRGYLMSQYSKFIRPGDRRVGASQPENNNVQVTAYKNLEGQTTVVAVNRSNTPQQFAIDVYNGCVTSFAQFTTSETKNVQDDGQVAVVDNRATVTVDAQSVTTFVGQ